jgi:membrane dipeptidase
MRDVLGGKGDWEGSIAPPIYSHSSAYSICPHPRNVKDDILELVKRRNSVVMVNIAPQFISCRSSDSDPSGMPEYVPEEATLDQVVKHIMHIGELIGYEHVGIGTDFDGIEDVPKGLEDVSKYPDLVAALLENGVSASHIRGIIGGNVLRVWAEVDRIAAVMQATMAPIMEDDEPDLFDTANIQG